MSNTVDGPKAPFVPNYLLYLLAAASEAASARFHSHVRTRGLRGTGMAGHGLPYRF